ncbi:MAG: undecaprenyl-diphosphate phosphatase [Clostridia bacterium]|nr:undecaprenyl-diphosphate phosphatase [Clostridia bacterium]
MNIFDAVFYGIVQGIAEFLPISSSGHLALMQNFFSKGESSNFAFNIALHFATLISVCIVYRKDVYAIIKGFFSLVKKLFTGKIKQSLNEGERLFLMLCIATAPLVPVKLLGFDEYVKALTGISWVIGGLLIINGVMLFVGDRLKNSNLAVKDGGYLRPLGVGVVQAIFGVMPGISRSGSTIIGGRILGYSRESAVKFSFLMSIPAILGASVLKLPDMFSQGMGTDMIAPLLVGAAVAAVVGFFAIKLLQYLATKNFTVFSVYCIAVGAIAIVADIIW